MFWFFEIDIWIDCWYIRQGEELISLNTDEYSWLEIGDFAQKWCIFNISNFHQKYETPKHRSFETNDSDYITYSGKRYPLWFIIAFRPSCSHELYLHLINKGKQNHEARNDWDSSASDHRRIELAGWSRRSFISCWNSDETPELGVVITLEVITCDTAGGSRKSVKLIADKQGQENYIRVTTTAQMHTEVRTQAHI